MRLESMAEDVGRTTVTPVTDGPTEERLPYLRECSQTMTPGRTEGNTPCITHALQRHRAERGVVESHLPEQLKNQCRVEI